MKIFKGIFSACAVFSAAYCCFSCINADGTLGQDYIPTAHIWQVVNTSFDLQSVETALSDELGGYSARRMSVGGVSPDGTSWDEKESAFPLIPLSDTAKLDLGDVKAILGFHFAMAKDTLSCVDPSDEHIIQNIRVYELSKPLGTDIIYAGKGTEGLYDETSGVITKGIPVYDGGDSLSFDFSDAFARKYVDALKEMKSWSMDDYTKKLPGIVVKADRAASGKGRINMFETAVTTNDYGYLTGNYVELKLRSVFDEAKGPIDTSFVFMLGGASFVGESTSSIPTQYVFNICRREGTSAAPSGELVVEGGCGYKPVVRAAGLKTELHDAIRSSMIAKLQSEREELGLGSDREIEDLADTLISRGSLVINKATIRLPYKVDSDYSDVESYPVMLSPTCRLEGKRTVTVDGSEVEQNYVTFAGLTDASVSSENQGDINRSLDCYQPDVSHHAQELLLLKKGDDESDADYAKKLSQYDIWMLIMHSETNKASSSSSSSSSYNDYLNALAYSSYYNSLYGGYGGYGYGYGYGGYGYDSYGYGSYYNNYYNYMMMAQYASQASSTSTSTSTELDKDRYYRCPLYAPGSSEARPTVTITFSFPTETLRGE